MKVFATDLYGDVTLIPISARVPFREFLDWLTDLQETQDGTQTPVCLRDEPRQSFSMLIPIQPKQTQAALNGIHGRRGDLWAIPVWSEAQSVGTVSSGASSITCDGENRDFRDASLALLWNLAGDWTVVEIADAQAAALVLNGTVATTVTNAYLLPLRIGKITDTPKRASGGSNAEWELRFRVDDLIDLAPEAPTQFLGDDLDTVETYMPGSDRVDTNVQSSISEVDSGIGPVSTFDLWTDNRLRAPQTWVLEGAEEAWTFRLFLHRRRGKFRRFWQPSFYNDVRKKGTGTVTTVLTVWEDSRLIGATRRTHIAIQTKDGTWYPRTINSVATVDATTVELTLSSSLGGIAVADIVRVSYLGLKRLDTDRVELAWEGNGVCRCTLNIVEVSP